MSDFTSDELDLIAHRTTIALLNAPEADRTELLHQWVEPLDVGQVFTVVGKVIGQSMDLIDGLATSPALRARLDQNLQAVANGLAPLPAGYPTP